MADNLLIQNLLAFGIGYLLGSVSPAYLFGRLNHLDIRDVGTKNAGTLNVFHTLGMRYAIPTVVYDGMKGIFAIIIAMFLGADPIGVQVAGLAAIIGHVLPFYLHFKGGRGFATVIGLAGFYVVNYLLVGLQVLLVFLYLVPVAFIFAYIAHRKEVVVMLLLPLLGYGACVGYPENASNAFFAIVMGWGACASLWTSRKNKQIQIHDETFHLHRWRVTIRPLAVLFVPLYLFFSQIVALYVVGGIALGFFLLDTVRLLHARTGEYFEQRAQNIFKKGEAHRISSLTTFFISAFLSIWLFDQSIAIAALIFLIFGDIFAKIFGLAFGRHKFFSKSLEGLLANFGCSLIFGYVLATTLPISLPVIIAGGIISPIVEVLSFRLDDNLTVALVSGAVMTAVSLFL